MLTKIHPMPALSGSYDLRPLESPVFEGAQSAQIGVVRIGAGTRSPAEGYRASAKHEIATILKGRVRVDLPNGESRIADVGSVIVSSPAEIHATMALEDTEIFYVLVDPTLR